MKKTLYSYIGFLIFLTSCSQGKPFKFENPEVNIRVISKINHVLIAFNQDDEQGARKLQLRDKQGNVLDEITLRNEPFGVTEWSNDSITVCFFGSDIRFFTPWLLENNQKTKKLGNYFVRYNYEENRGGFQSQTSVIDSFDIKNFRCVLFYNKTRIVDSVQISDLNIYQKKFSSIKFNKASTLEKIYLPINENLIHDYLQEILYEKK